MALSKRLRYEVLRRDNFACRYCGAFSPIVQLVVDHVLPRKEGGLDVPENLVAACVDCNSGKSASMPPPGILGETEERQHRWDREQHGTPDEDDLREMRAYQFSLYFLETLSAEQVLHYIARTFAAALPYRPTHSELIIAAGDIAQRELMPGLSSQVVG